LKFKTEMTSTACGENTKVKVSPVTGRGGPQGRERLRLAHLLDNWLTDGVKVVQPFAPAALYPQGRFLVLISVGG
jgi:hypothetical protein